MRATVGPSFMGSKPYSRASAAFASASHLLPAVGKLLTTRIERTQPQRALLVVSLFQRGQRWISNLTGSLSRWSFRTLLQSFQESSCVSSVCLSPAPSLLTVHAPKHERSFLKCLTNALKGQSL